MNCNFYPAVFILFLAGLAVLEHQPILAVILVVLAMGVLA